MMHAQARSSSIAASLELAAVARRSASGVEVRGGLVGWRGPRRAQAGVAFTVDTVVNRTSRVN